MFSRSLMSLVLMRIVATCGTAAIAAYGIGLRFHMIALMPTFAMGSAAATMVGQNLGAGQPGRASRGAWLAAALAAGYMACTALIMIIFAPTLFRIFADDSEVILTGTDFLRTASPFYTFAALAIVLSRALAGAGDTVPPFIFTVICLWGIQVPLAALLSRALQPPTDGIWIAIATAITIHGLLAAAWFLLGRWKDRRIE